MENNKRFESKTFDTSTLKGLRAAERFKARMNNKYSRVTVQGGLYRVTITGAVKLAA